MTRFNSKQFKLEQMRKQKEHLKECFEINLENNFNTINSPVRQLKSKNINQQSDEELDKNGPFSNEHLFTDYVNTDLQNSSVNTVNTSNRTTVHSGKKLATNNHQSNIFINNHVVETDYSRKNIHLA